MDKAKILESRIISFRDILEEALYKMASGEHVYIGTLYAKHFKLIPYNE
jgi:hypothetical protein